MTQFFLIKSGQWSRSNYTKLEKHEALTESDNIFNTLVFTI